jgi:hypothetical protein
MPVAQLLGQILRFVVRESAAAVRLPYQPGDMIEMARGRERDFGRERFCKRHTSSVTEDTGQSFPVRGSVKPH